MGLRWKLYYADREPFSSEDGSPFDAPGAGLEVIVQSDDAHGREVSCGGNMGRRDDYWWWVEDEQRWQCGDYAGLIDYLMLAGPRKVLFGRTICDEKFRAIYTRAMTDPGFPPKTGWRTYEKPAWLTWE